ncbi:hypothetical protein SCHPADRAFT_932932 [Schizopora paradoxa]|uniref:F-box domain-containing protein n=1 Tax=Schizopora paradoxa TaxID=27342 RepID=A0A0H2RPE1_9AGAM|nr:hypothetical protein SCHPADRAFT_932932 [Schizopora paradoxa]
MPSFTSKPFVFQTADLPRNVTRNVPCELLDRIFEHCECRFEGNYGEGYGYVRQFCLRPLLLVCKKWHPVAERRLYTSVSVGTRIHKSGGLRFFGEGKGVHKFCETVQNNARIASLVRELHLGTSTFQDREQKEVRVRIIGICKNIEKIELYGVDNNPLDDLTAALAKTDLTSMELSYKNHRPDIFDAVHEAKSHSLSTTIKLLQRWPRLRNLKLDVPCFEKHLEHGASLAELPLVPGSYAALTKISIRGASFNQSQLSQLALISPAMEELCITVAFDCCEALRQCLEVWSSSLRRLGVYRRLLGNEKSSEEGCPVIRRPMKELRELRVCSPLIVPSTLQLFPKLERLRFLGDYSQGAQLAQVIREGEMPNVREISADFSSNLIEHAEDDEGLEEKISKDLQSVCASRKIIFMDRFTNPKWSADPEGSSESSDDLESYHTGDSERPEDEDSSEEENL